MKNLIFLIFIGHIIHAQTNLEIAKIPDSLMRNANAVMRFYDTEITLDGYDKITEKHRYACTILNEDAVDYFSSVRVFYDKFDKIKSINGSIYDASGKLMAEIKKSDIGDYSANNYIAYVVDNRYKEAKFEKKGYKLPYTVYFEYESENKTNTLFYPMWSPQYYEGLAIMESSFTVKSNIDYRVKELNLTKPASNYTADTWKVQRWEVKNLPAYFEESLSKDLDKAMVLLAPNKFILEGKLYSSATWQDLGKFYDELNKNMRVLPASVIEKAKELAASESTIEGKVKKIYEYMQSGTHYFNVSLGVGGWKSLPAHEVASKGYGDCKALTNYTKALLESIGIKSIPALVNAGGIDHIQFDDFPRMRFNHIILCVPTAKDTLWMECTSQNNPFGYLGDFTGNRKVLLTLPDGGKLTNSVNYSNIQNKSNIILSIDLAENNTAKVKSKAIFEGNKYEERNHLLEGYSTDKQIEWIQKNANLNNSAISKYAIKENKAIIPAIEENMEFIVYNFTSASGNRLFIKPMLYTTKLPVFTSNETRINNIYLDPNIFNFTEEINYTVKLPDNYNIESLPKKQELISKFGILKTDNIIEGNLLKINRVLKFNKGEFPKTEYNTFVDFIKNVTKADNQRVVLIKKN